MCNVRHNHGKSQTRRVFLAVTPSLDRCSMDLLDLLVGLRRFSRLTQKKKLKRKLGLLEVPNMYYFTYLYYFSSTSYIKWVGKTMIVVNLTKFIKIILIFNYIVTMSLKFSLVLFNK